jgi:hypothetical protein
MQTIPDAKGVEVSDLEQAWSEALSAIEEMIEEDLFSTGDFEGWTLNATDSDGNCLFSKSLDEMIDLLSHDGDKS